MSHILLKTEDHSRDSAGMRYVYPVVSRRAGGVSVGINLNPNNACNWRCVYCQVPGLTRGGPPAIDLELLERELSGFLDWAVAGDFMATRVPAGARRLVDVAFSGNGEPTSAAEFADAVALAERALAARGLARDVLIRLITNGSLLERKAVQAGIARIGAAGGEVWFKVDAATAAGLARINGTRTRPEAVARRLDRCAALAPTWVQTCLFRVDDEALGRTGTGGLPWPPRGPGAEARRRSSLQPGAAVAAAGSAPAGAHG
jgi:wyosine [tRNA(Phe)-imidazoG37] synthetase (radical SAM superfamily)